MHQCTTTRFTLRFLFCKSFNPENPDSDNNYEHPAYNSLDDFDELMGGNTKLLYHAPYTESSVKQGMLGSFNSPVVRSPSRGYGGARCPAYGFRSFQNQSKNRKLNSPKGMQICVSYTAKRGEDTHKGCPYSVYQNSSVRVKISRSAVSRYESRSTIDSGQVQVGNLYPRGGLDYHLSQDIVGAHSVYLQTDIVKRRNRHRH